MAAGPPDPPVNCTTEPVIPQTRDEEDVQLTSSASSIILGDAGDRTRRAVIMQNDTGIVFPPKTIIRKSINISINSIAKDTSASFESMMFINNDSNAAWINDSSDSNPLLFGQVSNPPRFRRDVPYIGPSVAVNCLEGYSGGLPQFFIIEAWQRGVLKSNMTG